jgi:ankyrin repeat protein
MVDPLGFELNAAAKSGFLFKVKELLAKGADVNFRNEHGATPLIEASMRGYAATVQVLLEHGADIAAGDSISGSTALSSAALTGQAEVVDLLLNSGADINAKDFDGRTALFEAALSGHLEVVAILLKRGADIHVRDIGGRTALTEANVWQEAEVAELLMKSGAYDNATAGAMLLDNWDPDRSGLIDVSKVPSQLVEFH